MNENIKRRKWNWRKTVAVFSIPILALGSFLLVWFFITPNDIEEELSTPGNNQKTYEIDFDEIEDITYLSTYTYEDGTIRRDIVDEVISQIEDGIIIDNPDDQEFKLQLWSNIDGNTAEFVLVDLWNGEETADYLEPVKSFAIEIK